MYAMSPEEYTLFTMTELKGDELQAQLDKDYKALCDEYQQTIARANDHPVTI